VIDYENLRLIWWLLLGILLIGFAVTDGYDLGVGAILRLIGHDDVERRMAIAAIEPNWEGHQVWFVLGGGAIFAAWPLLYAASFSGFYFAMLLVLLALIVRPVAFAFRDRMPQARWRAAWDSSSPVSCHRWCSESHLAICSLAFRSTSRHSCCRFTMARFLAFSIRSRCWLEWSVCPCWSCMARASQQ
jgi:hypothetical protein